MSPGRHARVLGIWDVTEDPRGHRQQDLGQPGRRRPAGWHHAQRPQGRRLPTVLAVAGSWREGRHHAPGLLAVDRWSDDTAAVVDVLPGRTPPSRSSSTPRPRRAADPAPQGQALQGRLRLRQRRSEGVRRRAVPRPPPPPTGSQAAELTHDGRRRSASPCAVKKAEPSARPAAGAGTAATPTRTSRPWWLMTLALRRRQQQSRPAGAPCSRPDSSRPAVRPAAPEVTMLERRRDRHRPRPVVSPPRGSSPSSTGSTSSRQVRRPGRARQRRRRAAGPRQAVGQRTSCRSCVIPSPSRCAVGFRSPDDAENATDVGRCGEAEARRPAEGAVPGAVTYGTGYAVVARAGIGSAPRASSSRPTATPRSTCGPSTPWRPGSTAAAEGRAPRDALRRRPPPPGEPRHRRGGPAARPSRSPRSSAGSRSRSTKGRARGTADPPAGRAVRQRPTPRSWSGRDRPLISDQKAINAVNFDRLVVSRFGAFPQKYVIRLGRRSRRARPGDPHGLLGLARDVRVGTFAAPPSRVTTRSWPRCSSTSP